MKWVYRIIGLVLLPLVLALGYTLALAAGSLEWTRKPLWPFGLGFLAYTAFHFILVQPVFIHVMGHELTHAFWAWVFGGNVDALTVTRKGGEVKINKNNFFIALAPYFFPIYTTLLIPVFMIAKDVFLPFVAFLLGASTAFHLIFTGHSLLYSQSDLKIFGGFFSIMLIASMNLAVLGALLALIDPVHFNYARFWSNTAVILWEGAKASGVLVRSLAVSR